MENRYYEPEINEFHIGFEFEKTSAYREMDGSDDVYRKHIMGVDPKDRFSNLQDI